MASRPTRDLSDRHEEYLAELIGGRRTPGSGNQFANQLDVRNTAHNTPFPFGIDGKATLGKSISVRLEQDWGKVVEQAHDLLPAMALRWYHDDRLRRTTDLILVRAVDFRDLLQTAREASE